MFETKCIFEEELGDDESDDIIEIDGSENEESGMM